MALVVFLKGVNVGGHRTFRPSILAKELKRFDVVNIGAAGTFVFRKPPVQSELRAEIARLLPFDTDVMICNGRELLQLAAQDPFAGQPAGADIVRFVSVLAKRVKTVPKLPLNMPATGAWGLKVLGCDGRFVSGLYRREMKAVAYLSQLEKIFGVAVTTRNWTTISQIVRVLAPS